MSYLRLERTDLAIITLVLNLIWFIKKKSLESIIFIIKIIKIIYTKIYPI